MALGGPENHCSGRLDPPSLLVTMVHITDWRPHTLWVLGEHLVIHFASWSMKSEKKSDSICASGFLSFAFAFYGLLCA